ncbi:MAG TPA: MgtC/SapB family protein [bacterium]
MSDLVVLQRLLVIALLAGVIGYERERHGRAAGFRTHIFVGVGSCLVMLTGLHLAAASNGAYELDPTRMAAQVVSGIGFLGAGTILRFRASVRGLTTAASLWVVCGIGLAVGAGFMSGALMAGGIVIVALFWLSRLEQAMRKEWYHTLTVEADSPGDILSEIRQVLAEFDVEIRDFEVTKGGLEGTSQLELHVKLLSVRDREGILNDLRSVRGVRRARWA